MMGGDVDARGPASVDPTFKVAVNKTFEFVTIFGPALYSENPVRTVKPRMPVDRPAAVLPGPDALPVDHPCRRTSGSRRTASRSVLLESYLNWTPVEFQLDDRGPPGDRRGADQGPRLPLDRALLAARHATCRSSARFWDTTDNLFVDPDAPSFDKATWIARRCVHPVWQVERDFGPPARLAQGQLREPGQAGRHRDQRRRPVRPQAGPDQRPPHLLEDLLEDGDRRPAAGHQAAISAPAGDVRRLRLHRRRRERPVPAQPPARRDRTTRRSRRTRRRSSPRVAWPTPFWARRRVAGDVLDFHAVHNSPVAAGPPQGRHGRVEVPQLGHVVPDGQDPQHDPRLHRRDRSRAGEEIKTAILEGKDLDAPGARGRAQDDLRSSSSSSSIPQINGDIWKMIEAVENNFDKRVGLTELMYGEQGSTQIRSAQEAHLRNQNMNVRPDDMRKQVEAWMTPRRGQGGRLRPLPPDRRRRPAGARPDGRVGVGPVRRPPSDLADGVPPA